MKNLVRKSTFIIILFISYHSHGGDLTSEQRESITSFISIVDSREWIELSESTSYPLRRNHPIKDVKDKEDFLKRIEELFDDSLIKMITNSNPDSNWHSTGYRGLQLDFGQVWLDDSGELIGLNYQSEITKIKELELIEADRESLPLFLREYERPILTMDVGQWVIRIDEMKDMSYRFVGRTQEDRNPNSDTLEVIINGQLEYHGSGGNHSYTFKNDSETFVCYINELGTDTTPEGELVIYKEGKEYRRYDSIELER